MHDTCINTFCSTSILKMFLINQINQYGRQNTVKNEITAFFPLGLIYNTEMIDDKIMLFFVILYCIWSNKQNQP